MRVGRLVRAPEFDPLEVRSFCCLRALAGAGGEIRARVEGAVSHVHVNTRHTIHCLATSCRRQLVRTYKCQADEQAMLIRE